MTRNRQRFMWIREIPSSVKHRLYLTGSLSVGLLTRRDTVAIFFGLVVGYLSIFLYMMNDIAYNVSAGFSWSVPVSEPLSLMFEQGPGQFSYEAIAFVELGVLTWTVSPINTLIGLFLASLVGLNLSLTYLAVTQPAACGLGAGSGLLASVPALLAGSTCCAPVIAVVFGLQMSGLLLTAFSWLLPVSVVLLLGSLVYVAGSVDPTAVT
ncbi:hypothetical protein ACFQJ7_03910 [Halovenus rubra]|uniref:Uncharacterized protein n=2 Tax=Halovenus rubra TaxID=869890 RepID=A0ACC7DXF6_9EURY|nr:hypothetical protein [Halovenus rubra]